MEQNFNLYHIFYTVAKCRNISGAARELYISQPAISKAISKLEQSLGTTLFYRSSRGVSLTEPGEILFAQVENAFQAITQGEEQLQRFQKLGMGHLSIGVSATLCKYVLLPILQPFIRQNPHIQLSIACQSSLETMQALEQGTLDIGLIGAEDDMSAFVFEPLTDIQDIFVTTHTYLDNLKERPPVHRPLSFPGKLKRLPDYRRNLHGSSDRICKNRLRNRLRHQKFRPRRARRGKACPTENAGFHSRPQNRLRLCKIRRYSSDCAQAPFFFARTGSPKSNTRPIKQINREINCDVENSPTFPRIRSPRKYSRTNLPML